MDELIEQIRELAEALAREHFGGPPVDPFLLAERLGHEVRREGIAARWVTRGDRVLIYLPADMVPDRARFTLAHEIVEAAGSLASPPLHLARDVAHRSEHLMQLGASDLLMPRQWFTEAGSACDWDLSELRERFEVSWEAAARRVSVCTPAIGTIVDNGRVATRLGSDGLAFPRRLAPEEQEAISAAYEAWPSPEPVRRSGPGFTCVAWPALPERNAIRRVCLLTFVED